MSKAVNTKKLKKQVEQHRSEGSAGPEKNSAPTPRLADDGIALAPDDSN
jgi:hypothetical protein